MAGRTTPWACAALLVSTSCAATTRAPVAGGTTLVASAAAAVSTGVIAVEYAESGSLDDAASAGVVIGLGSAALIGFALASYLLGEDPGRRVAAPPAPALRPAGLPRSTPPRVAPPDDVETESKAPVHCEQLSGSARLECCRAFPVEEQLRCLEN